MYFKGKLLLKWCVKKEKKKCDKNWIPISLLDVDTKNSIKNLC